MAQNPLANPEPWSLVAEGYNEEVVPEFHQYCRKALELIGYKPGLKVLDVACGPGTLSLLIADTAAQVTALDFSEGMLNVFRRGLEAARRNNISIFNMDGQKLEFAGAEFDMAFSMFGLMFFPDRMAGFREIYRVLKPGGRIAVSSWGPVADSPLMLTMFGALAAAFPDRPRPKTNPLNLENPERFKEEMVAAGFSDVTITAFDGSVVVKDRKQFLASMIRGSAPLDLSRRAFPEAIWLKKEKLMLDYLDQNLRNLPVTLHSRAFIGTGTKQP